MDCFACDAALPLKARFCPSCGVKQKTWEELMADMPAPWSPIHSEEHQRGSSEDNGELREKLIDCYLKFSISKELSGWLEDLRLPSGGTMQEKLTRLRCHAGAFVVDAESLHRQTIYYLHNYDVEILTEICQELRIDGTGPKEVLLTRIYREVGLREGWLQPLSEDARRIITETFIPILQGFDPDKDYFLDFSSQLSDLLIEVPKAYGNAIITVLIPKFFQEAQITLLENEINERAAKHSFQSAVPDVEPLMGLS